MLLFGAYVKQEEENDPMKGLHNGKRDWAGKADQSQSQAQSIGSHASGQSCVLVLKTLTEYLICFSQ